MASACAHGKIANQSNKESKSTPFKTMCGVVHASELIMARLWAPNELPRGRVHHASPTFFKNRGDQESLHYLPLLPPAS
jgi:hypothetical protein